MARIGPGNRAARKEGKISGVVLLNMQKSNSLFHEGCDFLELVPGSQGAVRGKENSSLSADRPSGLLLGVHRLLLVPSR